MRHFRQQQKLISLVFLLGFFFATLEIHADHDGDVAEQTEHCCVQCCPSHNLVPVSESVTAVEDQLVVRSTIGDDASLLLKTIPNNIFRPPIALS